MEISNVGSGKQSHHTFIRVMKHSQLVLGNLFIRFDILKIIVRYLQLDFWLDWEFLIRLTRVIVLRALDDDSRRIIDFGDGTRAAFKSSAQRALPEKGRNKLVAFVVAAKLLLPIANVVGGVMSLEDIPVDQQSGFPIPFQSKKHPNESHLE